MELLVLFDSQIISVKKKRIKYQGCQIFEKFFANNVITTLLRVGDNILQVEKIRKLFYKLT